MIDCQYCDGTGNDPNYEGGTIECPKCGGKGEVNPYKDFYKGKEGLENYYDEE